MTFRDHAYLYTVFLKATFLDPLQIFRDHAGQIEAAPVGSDYALFNPQSGAIVRTDALGMSVLGALACDDFESALFTAAPDIPKADVGEVGQLVLSEWQAAGLFDVAPAPFPNPTGRPGETSICLDYACAHGGIRVHTDDADMATELDIILASFKAPPHPAPDVFSCTTNRAGEMELFFGTTPIWSRTDPDEARFLLLKEAAQSLSGPARVGAVLHGAAVRAPDGGVLVFIGESGAGKSTLALGLAAAGWTLLADDHIPLGQSGIELITFPTASAVKPGSMDLPETQALRRARKMLESAREGVSYLSLQEGVTPGELLPIQAVVIPRYGVDLAPQMMRLSAKDAFFRAVGSGARPCRHGPRIAPLARLCTEVPVFELEFHNSDQSHQACLDLVAR